jgi:uncharacterized protein
MAARESASGSRALRDGRPSRRAEPLDHPSGAPRAALGGGTTNAVVSSAMIRLYIDADGCPVKQEVYRVAERYQLPVAVVANKQLSLPPNSLLEMVVVTGAFDAADDWIVENSQPNDIVVTSDILLADRCVKKSVRVLSPTGVEFTSDNIGSAVASRELMRDLRDMGEVFGGPAPMDRKSRSRFLGKLDEIIQSLKRPGA